MSRYTYAGTYRNPTEGFFVKHIEGFEYANEHEQAWDGKAWTEEGKVYQEWEIDNAEVPDGGKWVECEHYEIWVREDRAKDGSCPPDRPHSRGWRFRDHEEAIETLEAMADQADRDYEEYLEENSYEIAQQERYEMFRNEY